MTIGIAASGQGAGAAVYEALRVIETVSRGEIGGFVTLAFITSAGQVRYVTTQDGGVTALGIQDDSVASRSVRDARLAALISSGPNRPEPLDRFISADPTVGLVTGHRFPDAKGVSGTPLNLEVIRLARSGMPAREALEATLAANPNADCGLILATITGEVYAGNTSRVALRPDIGAAVLRDTDIGAAVAVLHNALQPVPGIAELAAGTAIGKMANWWPPDEYLKLGAGVPVSIGKAETVTVDDSFIAISVQTTDKTLVSGTQNGAAIYLGAAVIQEGRQIGTVVNETNAVIKDGRIVSMSGMPEVRIGFRALQETRVG